MKKIFTLMLFAMLSFINFSGLHFSVARAEASDSIEPKTENGISPTEILIGQTTNFQMARSKSLSAGSQVFFNKLNASGGVNGRKIKLIVLDDAYVPKKAVDNLKQLIDQDKVFALFQIYGTNTNSAALPLVDAANIPLIAPGTGAEFVRNPVKKNVFNVAPSYAYESKNIVDFIFHKKNIDEVCLFIQDDAMGTEGSTSTVKALAEIDKKVKISATYKRLTEDINEAFNYLKNADCKAIVMWSQTKPTLAFLKKAKQENFKPLFFAGTPLSGSEFYSQAGQFSDNLYLSTPVPLPTDKSDEFVNKFLSDSKSSLSRIDPSFFEGYLEAAVLTHAIRLAGKNLTRESLRSAFEEKMQNANFGKINLEYTKTEHAGLKRAHLAKVTSNGSLEPIK